MKKTDETKTRRSFLTNWRQFYRALSGKNQAEEYDPMDHAMEEARFEETLEPLPEGEGGFPGMPADAAGYAQQPGAFAYGAQPYAQQPGMYPPGAAQQPGMYPPDAAQQPGMFPPQGVGIVQPPDFGTPQGAAQPVHFSDGAAVVAEMEADPMRGFVSPAEHIYGASLAGDGMSEVYEMRQMQPPVDPAIADLMQDDNAQGNMDEWLERTFPEPEEIPRWVDGEGDALEYDKTQPFSALLDVLATGEEGNAAPEAAVVDAGAAAAGEAKPKPQEYRMEIPRSFSLSQEPAEPPRVHVEPVPAPQPPNEVVFAMDGSDADAVVIAMEGYDAAVATNPSGEGMESDAADAQIRADEPSVPRAGTEGVAFGAPIADRTGEGRESASVGDAARLAAREEPTLAAEETLPGLMAIGDTDIDPDMDAARAEEKAQEEGRLPFLSEYALTAFADQAQKTQTPDPDLPPEPVVDLIGENTVPPSETWLEVPAFGEASDPQAEPEGGYGPARIAETIRLAQEARNAERDDTPLPVEEQPQSAYYPDIDTIYGEPQDAWGTDMGLSLGEQGTAFAPTDGLGIVDAHRLVDVGYALERTQELGMQDDGDLPSPPLETRMGRGYEAAALGEETRGMGTWMPPEAEEAAEAAPAVPIPEGFFAPEAQGSAEAARTVDASETAEIAGFRDASDAADFMRMASAVDAVGDITVPIGTEAARAADVSEERDAAGTLDAAALSEGGEAEAPEVGGVFAIDVSDAPSAQEIAPTAVEGSQEAESLGETMRAAQGIQLGAGESYAGEQTTRAFAEDEAVPVDNGAQDAAETTVDAAAMDVISEEIPKTDFAPGLTTVDAARGDAPSAQPFGAMSRALEEAREAAEDTQQALAAIHAREAAGHDGRGGASGDETAHGGGAVQGREAELGESAPTEDADARRGAMAPAAERMIAIDTERIEYARVSDMAPAEARQDLEHEAVAEEEEDARAEGEGELPRMAETAAAHAAPGAQDSENVEIPIWEMRSPYADAQTTDEPAQEAEPSPAAIQAVSIDELVMPIALDMPAGEGATLLDDSEIDGDEAAAETPFNRGEAAGDWALSADIGNTVSANAAAEHGAEAASLEAGPASTPSDARSRVEPFPEASDAFLASFADAISEPAPAQWAEAVKAPPAPEPVWEAQAEPKAETQTPKGADAVPEAIMKAASEPQTLPPWAIADAQAPAPEPPERPLSITPIWDRAFETGFAHPDGEPGGYDRRSTDLTPHVPGADRIPGASAAPAEADWEGRTAAAPDAQAEQARIDDARDTPKAPIQVVDLEALMSRFNI